MSRSDDEINSSTDDKSSLPLLASVNDVDITVYHPKKEHVGPILCWQNPPNKVRKCWTKVNAKTIAGGVILFILVICAIIFSVSTEEKVDDIHLMAVSNDFPLVVPIDLVNINRRTVLEVLCRVQMIPSGSNFPNPTYFNVILQGSNTTATWTETQTFTLTAETDHPNEEEIHDFYLDEGEIFTNYRFLLGTNSLYPLSVTFRFRQLFEIVRYQVAIAAAILVLVYIVIVFELMHRTIIALVGSFIAVGVIALVHGRPSFDAVINWIDFDTVGLLFGMMVMVGIFSETGFFEWSAIKAYKLSKGNLWHLTLILCLFTAITSAFLDNVTTILLMAPVTIRLCKVLDVPPEPILLAEVMLSNIGGTATAIGDPPNIIIINDPDITASGEVNFFSFSLHVAPGVVFAAIACLVLIYYLNKTRMQRQPHHGKEKELTIWKQTASKLHEIESEEERKVKQHLLAFIRTLEDDLQAHVPPSENKIIDITELEEKYRIYDKPLFISSSIVLTCVIIMFFLHSWIHDYVDLSLAWIAIIGSMIHLLVSGVHDIEEVLEKVEFGTLLFFAGLFVLMHGLEVLGLIAFVGDVLSSIIESVPQDYRLAVAILLIIWVSAFVSAFIDNIPYTTAMVPVIVALAENPELGLELTPLTWALSFGTCFGGNGTIIGASANVVACGLAEQQGYPISFMKFFKMGFPVMLVSTSVATVYMLITHVLIPWY